MNALTKNAHQKGYRNWEVEAKGVEGGCVNELIVSKEEQKETQKKQHTHKLFPNSEYDFHIEDLFACQRMK